MQPSMISRKANLLSKGKRKVDTMLRRKKRKTNHNEQLSDGEDENTTRSSVKVKLESTDVEGRDENHDDVEQNHSV